MILNESTKLGARFAIVFVAVWFAASATGVAQNEQTRSTPDSNSIEAIVSGVRINVIEGRVLYEREKIEIDAVSGLELKADDRIETAPDGRAEVLLQPSYVLRLGPATACGLLATEPDKIKLKLAKGSISFEVLKDDVFYQGGYLGVPVEAYLPVTVITDDAEVVVGQPGIYRINLVNGGRTELIVRDGEAVINGQRIKQKRVGRADRDSAETAEFNLRFEDTFDGWCRDRARALVVANRLLRDAPWMVDKKNGREATIDLPPEEDGENSAFVLSAKPATVNFVEPGVEAKQGNQDWRELTAEVDLEAGASLRTGTNSRTELLLLPNIYLRIDGDSEVILPQLSYEALRVNVLRGSVILDVVKFNARTPAISVDASTHSFSVVKAGNYRVNVANTLDTTIVRKGKVIISGRELGSCRKLVAGVESGCDEKLRDSFDVWSIQRGEGQAFDGRPMEAYLSRIKRNRTRSTGFWYLHPKAGYYTFIPFFSAGFRSPYGGRYANVFSQDRRGLLRRSRHGRSEDSR